MKKHNGSDLIIRIILFLFLISTVLPLLIMIFTSLKDETQILQNFWGISLPFHWENYTEAWNEIGGYFYNSFKVTLLSVGGIVVISTLAGYAFAKLPMKGRQPLYMIVMSFRMVPVGLLIIPMFMNVLSLNLDNSHWGVILVNMATGSTMAVMLTKSFFEQLPNSIFESAKIDGAGELAVMTKILLQWAL